MSALEAALDELRAERDRIDGAIAAIEALLGRPAPKARATRAPRPPKDVAPAKRGAAAPSAYDPKIKGREHYLEVLRKVEKGPKARADLVGSVPQRSKALNKMVEHGLMEDNDGFLRITEAGELYLLEANP